VGDEREGSGKGAGRERVGGWVPIGEREGRNNRRNGFPRLQRFPVPKPRRDQRWEPLVSDVAEGGKGGGRNGRSPSGEGGIDDQKWDFPRLQPQPERRRCCARRGRINAIKGVGTQNNGTRGLAEFRDEYG
jgi:hypothetical protein